MIICPMTMITWRREYRQHWDDVIIILFTGYNNWEQESNENVASVEDEAYRSMNGIRSVCLIGNANMYTCFADSIGMFSPVESKHAFDSFKGFPVPFYLY